MAIVAIIPVLKQEPNSPIKPYCGAKVGGSPGTVESPSEVYKAPAQAWADIGIVKHMQAAVVPEASLNVAPPHLKPRFKAGRCLFRFSAITLAIIENLLGYLAYLEVAPPEDSFYNKFEAHMLGYPALDMVLLIVTILNSCYLFSFWCLIGLMRRDLYGELATGRLLFSLALGGICSAIVFFGEGTKLFPFFCSICVMLHLLVWTSGLILRTKFKNEGKEQHERTPLNLAEACCGICGFFLVVWLILSLVMFLVESADYLYDGECPATTNTAMPVRIKGVLEWQCVKWGEPHYIRRITPPGQPIQDALCSTSFHSFNSVVNSTTGEQAPSSAAHLVRCPSHCQELGLGTSVIGCKVYDASSSICAAAVQMGILPANIGGVVKVVGRSNASTYERCNRHGILSVEASPTASNGFPPWAFYFQVDGMESLDMVTLHSWKKMDAPRIQKPWKSYIADVTWVVGGTKRRQEVVLGPGGAEDIELNFCGGSASCKDS